MLLKLALWIQATDFFTYLRGSAYVYPSILSLHMVGIAFFGGMILMTDMRLLGLAMRNRPVSDVVDQLRVPKRYGFLLAATMGVLMLGCKAEEYYYNAFFRAKVTLLILIAVHALIFRGRVYTRRLRSTKQAAYPRCENCRRSFARSLDRYRLHGPWHRLYRTPLRHPRPPKFRSARSIRPSRDRKGAVADISATPDRPLPRGRGSENASRHRGAGNRACRAGNPLQG